MFHRVLNAPLWQSFSLRSLETIGYKLSLHLNTGINFHCVKLFHDGVHYHIESKVNRIIRVCALRASCPTCCLSSRASCPTNSGVSRASCPTCSRTLRVSRDLRAFVLQVRHTLHALLLITMIRNLC